MKLGYLAMDQHGECIHIQEHPRKTLLEKLGRKHAFKVFRDTKDGNAVHVGYCVAGRWFDVYEVHSWKQ